MKKAKANNPAEPFLVLSAILTGFERVDLMGTGLADTYYKEVVRIVGNGVSDELWAVTTEIVEHCGEDGSELEAAIRHRILASTKFGPIARNAIQLWYAGTWNELPQGWRDLYGVSPYDTTRISRSSRPTPCNADERDFLDRNRPDRQWANLSAIAIHADSHPEFSGY